MHKSIIFLIGSLVMLLPFVPNNMNIFSKVNAFEDYGYETDQYMKYAEDMTNNNYDKSQGNDFIKKINCNNINSIINGEGNNINFGSPLGIEAETLQHGEDTPDSYRYDEKTGKGNLDVDCTNNNNNGSTIPQGPEEPGPTGTIQINSTNLYRVIGEIVTAENNIPTSSVAICDVGDVVFEGGHEILVKTGFPIIFGEGPLPNPENLFPTFVGSNNTAYFTTILIDQPSFAEFRTYAECLDNPPFHIP